jgi:hypothetical protein
MVSSGTFSIVDKTTYRLQVVIKLIGLSEGLVRNVMESTYGLKSIKNQLKSARISANTVAKITYGLRIDKED